eukprot:1550008-Rhodomonas_salina.1
MPHAAIANSVPSLYKTIICHRPFPRLSSDWYFINTREPAYPYPGTCVPGYAVRDGYPALNLVTLYHTAPLRTSMAA